MRALIKIDMNNAAFDEHPPTELARILASLASNLAVTGTLMPQPLRDINGNRVGTFTIEE